MAKVQPEPRDFSQLPVSEALRQELERVSSKCINCNLCRKECAFLRKHGKPKEIADAYDPAEKNQLSMPFECSLCQLCHTVCPAGVNPAEMLLQMRNETVARGEGEYSEHDILFGYERRGVSKRYSHYALPKGCDTIFFPGCTLSGTRPDKTFALFERLSSIIPSLGVVLDCCTKISHDLGREAYFTVMFNEMKAFLLGQGVREVLVACPNCHKIFSRYGGELKVRTVYELLARNGGMPKGQSLSGEVTVHDPCGVRSQEAVQDAVRRLVRAQGLDLVEMQHSGSRTLCCGEGGSVGRLVSDFSDKWGEIRKHEAEGRRIITCCAGCAGFLNSKTPTSHVLDLVFEPQAAMEGKSKVARAPLTYLNRIRLKKRFMESVDAAVTRERTFTGSEAPKKGGALKRLTIFAAIVGAMVAIRAAGATRYLDQEALRQVIEGYGALAPMIYMLIYTVAPALFLPGLPITIVGGILFGPFWGVVYTIVSSTIGACMAFLISRYLARDWIEGKLKSPRWRRLDEGVERHGWKVVAFTRLIPVFPFNLLNYAFGVTKIRFSHYALATFICMLPACVAYIVFSSSLLEVIKGNISSTFVIGLGLVVTVSLIPFFYRRYKARKDEADPL